MKGCRSGSLACASIADVGLLEYKAHGFPDAGKRTSRLSSEAEGSLGGKTSAGSRCLRAECMGDQSQTILSRSSASLPAAVTCGL